MQPPQKGLQAAIKAAASAASQRPNQGNPGPEERQSDGSTGVRHPRCVPLGLGSLDLVFGEAMLAAGLIMASKFSAQHIKDPKRQHFCVWGGALGRVGRMGNLNWVISRFDLRSLHNSFWDPDSPLSDLRPQKVTFRCFLNIFYAFRHNLLSGALYTRILSLIHI